jgi:hypothetical protein
MKLVWVECAEHVEVVLGISLRACRADKSKFVSGANAHVVLHLTARRGDAIRHLFIYMINK